MKILFLILIMWFQDVPREYRSSNTLLIESSQSGHDLLLSMAKSLMDNDFEIEEMNEDFLTLRTYPKTVKNISQMQIRVKVRENKAEIQHYSTTDLTISGIRSSGWELENFRPGQAGSPKRGMYELFLRFINSLEGDRVFLKK